MSDDDEIDRLELESLSLLAEQGMARTRELSRQMFGARDARTCERLSREYERVRRGVLKDLEAAAMLRLRIRRRRRAGAPRGVRREIDGRTAH